MFDLLSPGFRDFMRARENSVKAQIGIHFRGRVDVQVSKPRWMPDRLYLWLMRTIVVIEEPTTVTQVDV